MVRIGDARNRETEHVTHLRVEVDPIRELRRILALHGQTDQVLAERAVANCVLEPPTETAPYMRKLEAKTLPSSGSVQPLRSAELADPQVQFASPVHVEYADLISSGLHTRCRRPHHCAAALAGDALRHEAVHVRLEVEHQVAADLVARAAKGAACRGW